MRGTSGFLALALFAPAPSARGELAPPLPPAPSHALVVEAPASTAPDAPLGSILDRMIARLSGTSDPRAAWSRLFRPGDRVGIKVSTSAAPSVATRPDLLLALLGRLESVGIDRRSVVVWDRKREDLERAGLTAAALGCRVLAAEGTYDPESAQFSPITGKLAFGDLDFKPATGGKRPPDEGQLSSRSHYARVPARELDKIITLLPMLNHESAGVSGALFHLTAANLDNWRRFVDPPHCGDPFFAELYASGPIRLKAVLHLTDARLVQFAGGPAPAPHYGARDGRLFMAFDPVALDVVAVEILDLLRREAKLPPASSRALYLPTAAQFGLGVADRAMIHLARRGFRPGECREGTGPLGEKRAASHPPR